MNHSKKQTNRLIHEKSPYLLQHAENPVDWYPWGEEAFENARKDSNIGQSAENMVLHTLRSMARGGIYDQLAGGFHRYSVDADWHVPHFEKMLYDNAQLASTYLTGYHISGDAFYLDIAEDTINYVLRDMTHAQGGFFSAQDADSRSGGNMSDDLKKKPLSGLMQK